MKILIATIGTRGDVQPYIALGRALMASGHDITICTCTHFEPFVRENGLGYVYVNNDFIDFMHSPEGEIILGKPSLICPFFGDQPFWGRHVERLGVGPSPIPQSKMTVDRLCRAIDMAMNDLTMRENAAALGSRLNVEGGTSLAVEFITQWMNNQ